MSLKLKEKDLVKGLSDISSINCQAYRDTAEKGYGKLPKIFMELHNYPKRKYIS